MTDLPTELSVLVWLMILAGSLWIPYIIGVNTYRAADVNSFQRPPGDADLPDWVARANRAHLNLLEQAVPFAVLILVLHAIGGFSALTAWTAMAFLGIRVAHAVGMISGLAQMPLRPLIFTAGWVCILLLAYAAFTA